MWEQISANKWRSIVLVAGMGAVLAAMGASVGYLLAGMEGAPVGVLVALVVLAVQLLVYYAAADSVLLAGMGAKELERDDSPRLFNIVEEMKIASGLEFMPRLYLISDPSPNAFAFGSTAQNSGIAVTSGLLHRLNRDELQGVIAHEMGHLRNRDVRFMSLAGVLLGSIIMLSEFVMHWGRWGGRVSSRSSSRDSGGGGAQVILLVVALLIAILGPMLAQILYFASSRKREYLADASAASYTRYPEGLASALEKIQRAANAMEVSKAVAPMFIVNPLAAADDEAPGLFSTHPPTGSRVKVLRAMGGAGLADYEAAYRRAMGGEGILGGRSLAAGGTEAIRASSGEGPVETRQDTRGTTQRLHGYLEVHCQCGMTMRVPELFENDEVVCIRCGAKNPLPTARERYAQHLKPSGGPPPLPAGADLPPMEYRRRGRGWENFRCSCGQTVQLSPSFAAPRTKCPKCRRMIEVEPAAA